MKFTTSCSALALVTLCAVPASAWVSPIRSSVGIRTPESLVGGRYGPRLDAVGDVGEEQREEKQASKSGPSRLVGMNEDRDWTQPIPYAELTIGVVKETLEGENRVSQTPDSVRGLVKAGFTVLVQAGGKLFVISLS